MRRGEQVDPLQSEADVAFLMAAWLTLREREDDAETLEDQLFWGGLLFDIVERATTILNDDDHPLWKDNDDA